MEDLYKYPRTYHLPTSPGCTSDDKRLDNIDHLLGKRMVVTEKMDGENYTLYPHHSHARSLDSGPHESRDWVKGLWGNIKHEIPTGWRICGESLYAKHSIHYDNLDSYFLVYSIWDDTNTCLSWDDTVTTCEMLGLKTVPVIFTGIINKTILENIVNSLDTNKIEGFVVRNEMGFKFEHFAFNVAKWVRNNHVQTGSHWMNEKIEVNKLKTI